MSADVITLEEWRRRFASFGAKVGTPLSNSAHECRLREVLWNLDNQNDCHWMPDGRPNAEVVRMMAGIEGLTAEQIHASVPLWNRRESQEVRGCLTWSPDQTSGPPGPS